MESYCNGKPFPHLVIEDAFPSALIRQACIDWPDHNWNGWFRYDSIFEGKLACPNYDAMPGSCRNIIDCLNGLDVVAWTGIPGLQTDSTLHGAGLHSMPRGGKLDMHLDCDRHPTTGLERRLNLILFCNPIWQEEWNGHLELWDSKMSRCMQRISPTFNRLVIFETSDTSYHGVPDILHCPSEIARRSIATYLWTPTDAPSKRPRARFVGRPQDNQTAEIQLARLERAGIK